MSTKTAQTKSKSIPAPPPVPSASVPKKAPKVNKMISAKTTPDQAMAALHFRICRGDFTLKPVETRVQYDKVVGVKPEDVRTFAFGSVKPKEEEQDARRSVVHEAMWRRICNGPSAIESPAIRKAIVAGGFHLRSVETRVTTKPVVFQRDHNRTTAQSTFFAELLQFNPKRLTHTNTTVKHRPQVIEQTLTTAMKAAIKTFPNRQLNHVVPKVTTTCVVQNKENKKEEELSEKQKILRAIVRFDQHRLKEVATVVKTQPQIVVRDVQAAPAPAPAAPVAQEKKVTETADLKTAVANVECLAAMGFGDKKANFQLLLQNGNDLVRVIEILLSGKN